MERVEVESEALASITSPAQALSSDPSPFRRDSFHSKTPIELESILAYLVLSIYEYAQRGNLAKMRNRASQAHDAATRLSLHEEDSKEYGSAFAEARHRAWWMTVNFSYRLSHRTGLANSILFSTSACCKARL